MPNNIRSTIRGTALFVTLLAAAVLPWLSCGEHRESAGPVDLLVVNARIVDGTGNPWYRGQVAVRGDRVDAVGPKLGLEARRVVDARGMVVAPGFIDIHNHCDGGIFDHPDAANFVRQGVTLLRGGPCGSGSADMAEYLAAVDTLPLGLNLCFTVGHNSLRSKVMGGSDRAPTPDETERMKELVESAMKAGAVGLSTGLKYTPGAYAETGEVIELARVAARYGGFYVSHLREEGPGVIEAVAEAITIGEQAGLPVDLTHHKAIGPVVWGASRETLRMVDEARERGLDVTMDQYPYSATSTGLGVLFPSWSLSGGRDSLLARLEDPELRAEIDSVVLARLEHERGGVTIQIASAPGDSTLAGKSLAEILGERGQQPTLENARELVYELQASGGASCIYHVLSAEDIERIMRHPATMHSSDGSILTFGEGSPHPRSYGTFPRVLALYVREKGLLRLEEAVRKMTSLPAQRLGFTGRGVLRPGAFADLVIFDPDRVRDRATFLDPHRYPEGIVMVVVNGEVVLDDGELTGARPGRLLRGPGARSQSKL